MVLLAENFLQGIFTSKILIIYYSCSYRRHSYHLHFVYKGFTSLILLVGTEKKTIIFCKNKQSVVKGYMLQSWTYNN